MYWLDMGRSGNNGQENWYSDRTWVENGVQTSHGRQNCVLSGREWGDGVLTGHGQEKLCTDWPWAEYVVI